MYKEDYKQVLYENVACMIKYLRTYWKVEKDLLAIYNTALLYLQELHNTVQTEQYNQFL